MPSTLNRIHKIHIISCRCILSPITPMCPLKCLAWQGRGRGNQPSSTTSDLFLLCHLGICMYRYPSLPVGPDPKESGPHCPFQSPLSERGIELGSLRNLVTRLVTLRNRGFLKITYRHGHPDHTWI